MTDSVIELDVSVPWEPPEPPAPRRRLQARWVAAAAVLVAALGVLVAAGPRSDAGRLYSVEVQVLQAQTAGGRLFIARYQGTAPGPMIEARRAADGVLLWEHSAELPQQMVVAGADVVILLSEERAGDAVSNTVVVLDAATGRQLWSRAQVLFEGINADVVIVEDEHDGRPARFTDDPDPGVNFVGAQPQRRFLGLSARTGATTWDVTVPEGNDVALGWESPYRSEIARLDVLSRSGQLTRRDARTGAVTSTRQLDWPGAAAALGTGWIDGYGRAADRLVVYPDGERAAAVYDLATGRLLFHWANNSGGGGLFPCTDRLYCANDDAGLTAVDATTGETRWHLDGPDTVVGFAGSRLLVGTFSDNLAPLPTLTGIVDGRTGAVVKRLAGWRILGAAGSGRPLVWRPVDERTAVLGELDPATGAVGTFAVSEDWFGNPSCSVDGRILACIVAGELSVWRLPNPH